MVVGVADRGLVGSDSEVVCGAGDTPNMDTEIPVTTVSCHSNTPVTDPATCTVSPPAHTVTVSISSRDLPAGDHHARAVSAGTH